MVGKDKKMLQCAITKNTYRALEVMQAGMTKGNNKKVSKGEIIEMALTSLIITMKNISQAKGKED